MAHERVALHVGAGGTTLPPMFRGWREVSLDIDPRTGPDIVGSMTDLGAIGPFDAIYSSHSLEHLPPADVAVALAEFRRVLRPDGLLWVNVPDTEGVEPDDKVLFVSPAGPITGRDLWYGHQAQLAERPAMAHHVQFTEESLRAALAAAGFGLVRVVRAACHNLCAVAFLQQPSDTVLAAYGRMFAEALEPLNLEEATDGC